MGSYVGNERAFGHGQILEIAGHVLFGEPFFNVREIATRTLEPQKDLSRIPDRNGELPVQHFPDITIFKRDRFPAETERLWESMVFIQDLPKSPVRV
jgi:hypothetical protein